MIRAMCNLYSMTTTHSAMRQLFRLESGCNHLRLPGISPDYQAPIVRRSSRYAIAIAPAIQVVDMIRISRSGRSLMKVSGAKRTDKPGGVMSRWLSKPSEVANFRAAER